MAFRLLLSFLAVSLLVACLGDDGYRPIVPDNSAAIALKRPTPTPTPTPTPIAPPALETDSGFAYPGGLLLARLLHPPQGDLFVTLAGAAYPLLQEADVAFTVIGLDLGFLPGDYALTAFADGEEVASTLVSVTAASYPVEDITLPPETAGLLADAAAIAEENRTLATIYARFTAQRLWSGPWSLPAQGDITNPFGLLRSINGGPRSSHSGTDIAAAEGTPVLASAGGRVAFAGPLYLRGNSVVIDHGGGVFSGYHHLAVITVATGQAMAQGELIGQVGATGLAGGPHLHWEVIVHGTRVDPVLWTFRGFEP